MKKSLGAKTIVYPTPVWIVGTYDADDKANGMTAAWAGVCRSDPPCVAVSIRKARHTYAAIVQRKAFTISIPSESYATQADYFGMASGKTADKFAVAGLTAVRSELVDAPYVGEFPLVLECGLLHTFELGVHTQFVGRIEDVKADQEVLDQRGRPDVEKIKPISFAPETSTYHAVGRPLGQAYSIGRELKTG